MRTGKYLDAVIERHDLKNDRKLAEFLGVAQSAISQYRTGKRSMDNEMCLRVAQALDMTDPLPIIMAADLDRAERAGQRSLWEVFSPRMAHSGLTAILITLGVSVTNFVTPSPAEAAPLSHSAGSTSLHYVK
ncbi:helix-turn-helix domain-containing protein [Ralstonia sp.]|uniref:helix-turn-helix domain-containing protein n=1 Tax=Ralstonia sp. TaxID=54061 RepID=UPI002C81DBEE|nr:helix-turn-helix domain-containing protein [Ralstonia sp.]HWV03909.1 helix-turn-helix domain-containing protein [Ralstonia sp.]